MQATGVRFAHVQNFLISLSGHALCFLLIFGMPSCSRFARPKKPEHKVYTFDLIDPKMLSMKKTEGSPGAPAKTKAASEAPIKAAPKKEQPKKEQPKKEAAKKEEPKKKPPEKKAPKKDKKKAEPAPKKKFALPKKTMEERIKEQLKKIEEEGAKEWVEADKADTLTKPASQDKVAEQGIAGLLNTGEFANINYNDAVASLIYQTWQPPSKTPADKEGSTVVVRFKIKRDGSVINPVIEKKSGSEVLDGSALQAIKDASPMPPLPEDYTGDAIEVCMTFVPILEE